MKKFLQGGKGNSAIVMTDNIDKVSEEQILTLLSTSLADNSTIRIMPDVHAGKGCVIGLTMTLKDRVAPSLVGVDIGCGLITVSLGKADIDLEAFNSVINKNIPTGANKREESILDSNIETMLKKISIWDEFGEKDVDIFLKSAGTLGGGNHFIELGEDSKGGKYLLIHSGSRNLGLQVATHHFEKAKMHCKTKPIPENLSYLEGEDMETYLKDMEICVEYAKVNRETMADIILRNYFGKSLKEYEFYHTTHNYVSGKFLRKGAVSAKAGELLTIPLNMRDGSLLCIGKGNHAWNLSSPHGAGRKLSRREAKNRLDFGEYKKSMEGVYSTTIKKENIDESVFCYKDYKDIIKDIEETVVIVDCIKPILNYKG